MARTGRSGDPGMKPSAALKIADHQALLGRAEARGDELCRDEVIELLGSGGPPDEELAAWRAAGADRYLLRFETSDRRLYEQIHPSLPHRRSDRFEILRTLGRLGYEVGSGVMIGIPGQTYDSLADDLERFLPDRTVLARRSTPVEQITRWCRRNQVVAGLLLTVATTLMLGIVASSFFAASASRAAKAAVQSRDEADRQRQRAGLLLLDRLVAHEAGELADRARRVDERPAAGALAGPRADAPQHRREGQVLAQLAHPVLVVPVGDVVEELRDRTMRS